MPKDRMAIIVFSGTVDKLMPVGVLTSGAVAMDMDVDLFFTFWGLTAIRKDTVDANSRFSKDFEDMGATLSQLMKQKQVPRWSDMVRNAKKLGNVRVHACSMTYDLMGMKKEELDDMVDDIIAVGEFIDRARDAKITLFI
ncbi:MAG: DsrE/DsrF/DrsH-like family protein [Nitrososphaerota archaeon]|nr:DsrE/DsrF/DrsH-like family protein [Nitrososphaerota archaeon]